MKKMMIPSRIKSTFLLLGVLALSSCATVSKPKVYTLDSTPIISPVLKQAKLHEQSGLKRKVAVARFTNETSYGQGFFVDENRDRIGKQAVDILSSKLMLTEKFILLERADLDKIQQELSMEGLQPLRNKADYLIVGSITEFGRKEVSEVGIFSRVKKQVAFAKVHVRLVDVSTGQILYSEEGQSEAFSEAGTVLGVGERAGYDSTLNDKVLESAITDLASNIIENLLDKPWKAFILGYEDESFIISGGKSQNIKMGNEFDIVLKGKEINNPQTNMKITLPGKKIGKLKVSMVLGDTVDNEVSLCSLIDGDLGTYKEKNDFSNLYITESTKEEK
ncbi:MAG: curli biogenesis system outer membrane secretion channel CsgG [Chlamydiales bacterium]|jgi:curli biogenesis system outer membrane secretion channel CsgG